MGTQTLLFFAIGVFTLMVIGIALTALEFRRLEDEESRRAGRRNKP
ncbi:MAG: hypothetical protein ABI567_06755 [Gammaproteobacteria bacterium]